VRLVRIFHPLEVRHTIGGRSRIDSNEFEPPEPSAELLQIEVLEPGTTVGGVSGCYSWWRIPTSVKQQRYLTEEELAERDPVNVAGPLLPGRSRRWRRR
jgi:hypothetical protein